jgi:hypothetical protein
MILYTVSMISGNEANTMQNRLNLCRCSTCAYIDSAHTYTVHRLCCTATSSTSSSRYLSFCIHWREEAAFIKVLCVRSDMCFDEYLHDLDVTVAVCSLRLTLPVSEPCNKSGSLMRETWRRWLLRWFYFISSFPRFVNEITALVGCYAV